MGGRGTASQAEPLPQAVVCSAPILGHVLSSLPVFHGFNVTQLSLSDGRQDNWAEALRVILKMRERQVFLFAPVEPSATIGEGGTAAASLNSRRSCRPVTGREHAHWFGHQRFELCLRLRVWILFTVHLVYRHQFYFCYENICCDDRVVRTAAGSSVTEFKSWVVWTGLRTKLVK